VGFVFIENPMQLIYFNQNYLAILCSIMIILLIDREKAKYFLENSLMAACAIGAMWYFSLFLMGWDVTERYNNPIILPDRNYASLFLSFGVAVAVTRFQNTKSTEKRLYALILGAIILGQLLLASRAGVLTTCGIFLYSILRSEDVKSKISFIFIILILAFFIFTYASSFVIFERFTEDNIETGGGRTSIWENTFDEYIKQDLSKIIWGGGFSHTVMNLSIDGYSTHNNYLEEMFDYGIVGLIIMLVLMVTSFIAGDTAQRMVLLCFIIGFFSLVPLMYIEFWMVFSYLMIPANKKGLAHAN
jgi:O-antigen ligase